MNETTLDHNSPEARNKAMQDAILSKIVLNFADDKEFIKKVNKVTFGLLTESRY